MGRSQAPPACRLALFLLLLGAGLPGARGAQVWWATPSVVSDNCCPANCCRPGATDCREGSPQCKFWDDASCWSGTGSPPGPNDHAMLSLSDGGSCTIYLPDAGVDVDAISFAGSGSIVLRSISHSGPQLTVGFVTVSMDLGSALHVDAALWRLAVRRQVRVEKGEVLWQVAHIFCSDDGRDACPALPAVPSCNMSISGSGVACLVAPQSDVQVVRNPLCLNFLVETGGGLNIGGRGDKKYTMQGGVLENFGKVQVSDLAKEGSGAVWRVQSSGTLTLGSWQLDAAFISLVAEREITPSGRIELGFRLEQGGVLQVGEGVGVVLRGGGVGSGSFVLRDDASELTVHRNFQFTDTAKYEGACVNNPVACSKIRLEGDIQYVTGSSVGLAGWCKRNVAFFASVNLQFTGSFQLEASCSMQIEDVGGRLPSLQGRGRPIGATDFDVTIKEKASWRTALSASAHVSAPYATLLDMRFRNQGSLHLESYRVMNENLTLESLVWIKNEQTGITNLSSLLADSSQRFLLSNYGTTHLEDLVNEGPSSLPSSAPSSAPSGCTMSFRVENFGGKVYVNVSDHRDLRIRLEAAHVQGYSPPNASAVGPCIENKSPSRDTSTGGIFVRQAWGRWGLERGVESGWLHEIELRELLTSSYVRVALMVTAAAAESGASAGAGVTGNREWVISVAGGGVGNVPQLLARNVSLCVATGAPPVPLRLELVERGSIECQGRCEFAQHVDVRGDWSVKGAGPLVIGPQSTFTVSRKADDPGGAGSLLGEDVGGASPALVAASSDVVIHGRLELRNATARFRCVTVAASTAVLCLCQSASPRRQSSLEGDIRVLKGTLQGAGFVKGNVTLSQSAKLEVTRPELATGARHSSAEGTASVGLEVFGGMSVETGSEVHLSAWSFHNATRSVLDNTAATLSVSRYLRIDGRVVVAYHWLGPDEVDAASVQAHPITLASSPHIFGTSLLQHNRTSAMSSRRQGAVGEGETGADAWGLLLEASVSEQQRAFRGVVMSNGLTHTQQLLALFQGCPSGTAGTHTCTNCAPGTFSRREKAPVRDMLPLACRPCPPGHHQNREGQTECIRCPAGKYADDIPAFACKSCPPGHVQGLPGSSGCHGCEAGKYADAASTYCLRCPAMTFSPANATHCEMCASNATKVDGGAAELPAACQQTVAPDVVRDHSAIDAADGGKKAEEKDPDKKVAKTLGGLPLGYVLGLGMLGFLAIGAGVGLCGCGCCDAGFCQRSRASMLRRLLPSASQEEPPTRSSFHRWKLDKLEAISDGTNDVLLRTVALRDHVLVRVDDANDASSLGPSHAPCSHEQLEALQQQDAAAKRRSSVILSASFSLQGDDCLPDTCFEKVKANRLLCLEAPGTLAPRIVGLADVACGHASGGSAARISENSMDVGDRRKKVVSIKDKLGPEQNGDEEEWEHTADAHGRPFWYHVPTKSSVWEQPRCFEGWAQGGKLAAGSGKEDTGPAGEECRAPPHLAGYHITDLGFNPSVDTGVDGGDARTREGHERGSGGLEARQRDGRRVSFQDQLPATVHGAQEQMQQEQQAWRQAFLEKSDSMRLASSNPHDSLAPDYASAATRGSTVTHDLQVTGGRHAFVGAPEQRRYTREVDALQQELELLCASLVRGGGRGSPNGRSTCSEGGGGGVIEGAQGAPECRGQAPHESASSPSVYVSAPDVYAHLDPFAFKPSIFLAAPSFPRPPPPPPPPPLPPPPPPPPPPMPQPESGGARTGGVVPNTGGVGANAALDGRKTSLVPKVIYPSSPVPPGSPAAGTEKRGKAEPEDIEKVGGTEWTGEAGREVEEETHNPASPGPRIHRRRSPPPFHFSPPLSHHSSSIALPPSLLLGEKRGEEVPAGSPGLRDDDKRRRSSTRSAGGRQTSSRRLSLGVSGGNPMKNLLDQIRNFRLRKRGSASAEGEVSEAKGDDRKGLRKKSSLSSMTGLQFALRSKFKAAAAASTSIGESRDDWSSDSSC